jgi:uncharacterized protein YoxC
MIASFGWSDLAYLALAVFLVLAGLALGYGALRLGATLKRASSLIEGTERDLLPVISRLGTTVDRVNDQLEKVDQITDSVVDAVSGVDTAVRTVTGAVSRPVERLAGLVAGVRHAASSLRARGTWHDAVTTGREEAARREQELNEELGRNE